MQRASITPASNTCRSGRRLCFGLCIVALIVAGIGSPGSSSPATIPTLLAAPPAPPPLFIDVTTASGLDFVHHDSVPLPGLLPFEQTRFGAGGAAGDYDRDGDLDLYLVDSYQHSNRLFRNNGDKTFTDVTAQAGVGDLGHGHMALFADLDNDGCDDLVVFNDAAPTAPGELADHPFSQIYRNRGNGTFENVSRGSGFEPVVRILGGATAADFDHDGDLDLYLGSWFDLVSYLYRNDGDFHFTEITEAAGLRTPETAVEHWTPLFVDLDNDGWQDLFGAADFDEDYFFRNQGDGTFIAVPGDYHLGNDMGIAAADFDEDGDIDLYTTNITAFTDPFPCCNWLYRNDGTGAFVNDAGDLGVRNTHWGWGTAFFDADLDGDLDLLAVNGWQQFVWDTPATFFLNDGSGYFDEMAAAVGLDHPGNSRSLIPFDYDGDGDLDVLVTDILAPVTLYENVTSNPDRHYLTVRLRGIASNRNGIGARVTVTTGTQTWMREITAGQSFYAGLPLEAHFGLGPADSIDSLEIQWPTGQVQVLANPAVDRILEVTEAGAWGALKH